jgi:hypothetical protein
MQDVGRLVAPYRAEFFKPLSTSSEVQWYRSEIFDSTAVVACTILASKIHTNLTSPSTRWFGLTFRDSALNERGATREWLEDSESRMWQAIQESDFNTEAPEVYNDLTAFGTSVIMMEEQNDLQWEGVDFTALPIQDTYFEMGSNNRPSRLYRKRRFTRLQIEERFPDFDMEKFMSESHGSDEVDRKFDVIFCVYYRNEKSRSRKPEDRPVGYKYVLKEAQECLEEGGYNHFPGMVVRWQKAAGTDWGFSPSMILLSDIKQVNEVVAQTSESRAKAIDPPYLTTSRGVIGDFEMVPGALIDVEDIDEVKPLMQHARFDQADAEIERLQDSINRGYFRDMLQLKESPQMTATEARIRYEEIMSMMAPTLGRLQNDFLKPMIETLFMVMLKAGRFLDVPPQLEEADLDIEFTGPLARAQRADVSHGLEIWLGNIVGMAEAFPEALDIPDIDTAMRLLAELNGVPAKATRDQQEVEEARAARREQQEAMAQLQMAEQAGAAGEQVGKAQTALRAVE